MIKILYPDKMSAAMNKEGKKTVDTDMFCCQYREKQKSGFDPKGPEPGFPCKEKYGALPYAM